MAVGVRQLAKVKAVTSVKAAAAVKKNAKRGVEAAAEKKPMRRKRRAPEEIRERLLCAAREEFRQFGFVGATTAAIARSAEVTEAQLFRYFPSKADLFREAVFEPLSNHIAEFNQRHRVDIADLGDFREQTHLYIDELRQFLDEHSKLMLSLIVAQLFTSGSMKGVAEIDSLRHYFEQGAALMRKRTGKNARVDPKLLVRVSFAAVLGCVIFKDWIFPGGLASDDECNAAIIDFVIDGIRVNEVAPVVSGNKSGDKTSGKKRNRPDRSPAA